MRKRKNCKNVESESPPLASKNLGGIRLAFKMQLFKGFEAEYKKRHNEMWPELEQLLKQSGISEYSIFLDEPTSCLFVFLKSTEVKLPDDLTANPVMERWWKYMGAIMET